MVRRKSTKVSKAARTSELIAHPNMVKQATIQADQGLVTMILGLHPPNSTPPMVTKHEDT